MNSERGGVREPTTCGPDLAIQRNALAAASEAGSGRRQPGAARCLAGGRGRSVMIIFDIVVVRTGRAAVVQVRGELDLSTAPRLDERLVSLADEGVLDVTLDLADLDFIDSSGLQTLVDGLERLREQGGDLGLRASKPSTLRVLEITGLTRVFRLDATEAAGSVDAISGPGAHYVEGR